MSMIEPVTEEIDGVNDADVAHCYDGFEHEDGTFSRAINVALCGFVDTEEGPLQIEVPAGEKCPICFALWKARRGLL